MAYAGSIVFPVNTNKVSKQIPIPSDVYIAFFDSTLRTVLFERLPSKAGVLFLNRLPNSIKNAPMPKAFKARLKLTLVANAFYNTDEFMAFN
ncbi:hypothetical protein J6590_007771 [Homalodisca vitripennis]|nr:hypothetical protein J6590_007771 [Homalodisca vitripennis]